MTIKSILAIVAVAIAVAASASTALAHETSSSPRAGSVVRVRSAAAPIQWTAAQLKALADAYSAKNPGWRAPSGSLAENRSPAQITWTSENLDALASAFRALNPGWTRP
jgi:hypothetical protein